MGCVAGQGGLSATGVVAGECLGRNVSNKGRCWAAAWSAMGVIAGECLERNARNQHVGTNVSGEMPATLPVAGQGGLSATGVVAGQCLGQTVPKHTRFAL